MLLPDRWEYKTCYSLAFSGIETVANNLGKEGWELVQCALDKSRPSSLDKAMAGWCLVFKRPVFDHSYGAYIQQKQGTYFVQVQKPKWSE